MKKVYLLVVLMFATVVLFAQGIKFEDISFNDALKKAKLQNKKVFVDCYTEWCGPCKRMAKTLFKDEKLGQFIDPRFVAIKVDCGSKEGKIFGEKHKVNSYPTILLLENTGEELGRMTGAKSDVDLFIKSVKIKIKEEKSKIEEYEKRYNGGDRDPNFIREYIFERKEEENNLKSFDERLDYMKVSNQIYDWYKALKPLNKWINKEDFKLIKMYGYTEKEVFDFVCVNKSEFEKIISKPELTAYILNHVRFYTKSSVRHRRKDFLVSYRQASFFFPEIFKENIVEFTSHKYVNILRDAIRGENDGDYIMKTIEDYKNEKGINGKYRSDFGIALFWLERDCKNFSKEDIQKLILFFDKEAKKIPNGFSYRISIYKLALTAGESEMAEQGFKKLLREAKRKKEYSKHLNMLQKINDIFKKAHKEENKKTNV